MAQLLSLLYPVKAFSNKLARRLSPDGHLGRRLIPKRERNRKKGRGKARKMNVNHKKNK
jgi:hypothetical protein